MYPFSIIEFLQQEVHAALINALATEDGHCASECEEFGVCRPREADVVRSTRPPHLGVVDGQLRPA